MSKEHPDINSLTKDLLKKSIQKPTSPGFDDQLMEKILIAPLPVRKTPNGISLKKAWIFWLFTIILFITSLTIFTEVLGGYFNEVNDVFKLTINYIFYGGLALFMPLVLYYFDALIQLLFAHKNQKIVLN